MPFGKYSLWFFIRANASRHNVRARITLALGLDH